MCTVTETRTLYQYAELTADAQSRARDWFRTASEGDDHSEFVLEDAQRIATILGITLSCRTVNLYGGGTRQEPDISYSGFCSQGDGASWTGSYSYAPGSGRAIRAYAPTDTKLHRIADTLARVQRPNFYRLTAEVSRVSSLYSHSGTMSIDVNRTDTNDYWSSCSSDSDTIEQAMCNFADWIYRALEREYDHSVSDETVTDNIEANEYEFNSDGSIAA